MLKNDAFIITLAYPETIVQHPKEWFSKFLKFLFIGNENYVRAGHTALILVHKETGDLEYFDFGRYTTPMPYGRLRTRDIDFELQFSLKAKIEGDTIINLNDILRFFATQEKLTHGQGTLYASVCAKVDYNCAKNHINEQCGNGFVRYGAFKKNASNCARFVTGALIASVTDSEIKHKLIKSKRFTPSTVGNVVKANTQDYVYLVSENGAIDKFKSSVANLNLRLFLDPLKGYSPSLSGTMEPKHNDIIATHAKWLSSIGAGVWFEIYSLTNLETYRLRRVSPHGNVDCDGIYKIDDYSFNINADYTFLHLSNCATIYIQQNEKTYRFEYLRNYSG